MKHCSYCSRYKSEFGQMLTTVCTSCEIEIMQLVQTGEQERKNKPIQRKQSVEDIANGVQKMYAAMGYVER